MMFSNDQNIETISQLVDVLKHYIGLQSEYVKLDVIEKVVRLLTAAALALVLALLVIFILIFLSVAGAHALMPCTGAVGAYAIVAGFYLLLLVLVIIKRKSWIEKPLVKFLANLLLNNDDA